ncbi:MAG: hypothetical protein COW84_05290 [Gammaproteobacteria bacterium CG22_combo_CG10-13_8_21_14_all_40_8]|nr:MAG: hypothetical protein COW84_05290 [Gammaproteobacteria bacterium CG22_combo_CG10-13_8_21_14_all_40_8]
MTIYDQICFDQAPYLRTPRKRLNYDTKTYQLHDQSFMIKDSKYSPNRSLEDVIFKFVKIGEEELLLADKLKNTLRQTREVVTTHPQVQARYE